MARASWPALSRRPTPWRRDVQAGDGRNMCAITGKTGAPFLRQRLTLAPAPLFPPGEGVSTPVLLRDRRTFRGGGLFLAEALLQLGDDLFQILGFGVRVLGVLPLETRLKLAPDLPIGVAEMVVDDRVAGLQLDRLLQLTHGVVGAA